MEQSNQFFATANPVRLFLKVAIPGLISMLAMSLYQAFEGAFVGQILGEAAFAAINVGMPVVMINFSLADMVGVGSSVPISVSLGRKDEQRANNIFSCSVILIVTLACMMGFIIYFGAPLLVSVMGAEGELAELSIRYVRVFALLGPVSTSVFAFDNYLRISGFVKGSMFLNIFMSGLTVVLLALFLMVFRMDVEGSALASALAMALCALIALIPFIRKKAILRFVRPRFSLALVREIVTCGTPTFLNNVAGRVAAILMNSALIRLGGQTAVAAYSVMMYAGAVIEPMLYGMSDSIQPAVGYNWGAGSLNRVRDITKVSFLVCGLVSVACTMVMCTCPELLASIFVSPEETALMEMSIHAMPLFGHSFLFGWFGFAVQGFFAAVEKPLPATILSVCRAMVFPVMLIYGLSFLGLDGLWLNHAGTALLSMILAVGMLAKVQKSMKRDIQRYTSENSII